MSLKIINDAVDLSDQLRRAIESALPGASVEVRAAGAGHYEIDVVSERFRNESRVRQQQLVYGAIMDFMTGDDAPVHAIDRMTTRLP